MQILPLNIYNLKEREKGIEEVSKNGSEGRKEERPSENSCWKSIVMFGVDPDE